MSKETIKGIMSFLSFDNGKKKKETADKIRIINKIRMNNYICGDTYIITGSLIDKSTGKPFIDKNKKEVCVIKKIIVEKNEDIIVDFTFDSPDDKTHCLMAKTIIKNEDTGEEITIYDPKDKDLKVIIQKKRKWLFILILLFLLLLCSFGIYMHGIKSSRKTIPAASGNYSVSENDMNKKQNKNKVENASITFMGYNKASISKDNPNIVLKNPEINKKIDANFVFELKDSETGKLITRTEPITPGKYVYIDLYKVYQSGEHTINLKISPYDHDGQEKNGVTSNIILNVN